MSEINLTKSRFKTPLLFILIITLITISAGYFITQMIHTFYYDQMERECNRLANRYAQNMEMAIHASNIINTLMEQKILAAGKITAYTKTETDTASLKELANTLQVDVIYIYNESGEIIYSNNPEYIGKKPYQGHPVYEFMHSGETEKVEAIRPDMKSGIYYKYGYFRYPNGGFVQIGVLAEKIHAFMDNFSIEHLLKEITQDDYITNVSYIDTHFQVFSPSQTPIDSNQLLTKDLKAAMLAGKEYSGTVFLNNTPIYQVMLPVFVNGNKVGSLVIGHNIESTQEIIRNISIVGIASLLLIFILLIIIINTTYTNNQKLTHYVYYDVLTGLPNKEFFYKYVPSHARKIKKTHKALLLVNCRNFKLINFTYGYKMGDELLQEIALVLSVICSDDCHLFHLGGDRFILCISKYEAQQELAKLCNNIIEQMQNVLSLKTISIAIGVVEVNDMEIEPESLLKKAYLAAENVNEQEPFGYCFFNESMEDKRIREEYISTEIEEILADKNNDGIFLEYQPILNLQTNGIFGFEALARLNSKKLGIVGPGEFIAIAEKSPVIAPLGKKIIYMVCQFIKTLEASGYTTIKVSVNISAIQLLRDDFLPDLMHTIEKTGITPKNLGIEITESIFFNNYELINNKLAQIQELGIPIAIDDFGTGYSSLAREHELNVNCLKIDKYFMDKLLTVQKEESITGDIISIAHKLNHLVIAEGVETEAQKQYLIQNGCDCIQGFLFSKPLSPQAAMELLQTETTEQNN